MGNTTIKKGHFVEVTPDGTTDWTLATEISEWSGTGMKVRAISFRAEAAGSYIEVREQGIDNALIWRSTVSTAANQVFRVDFGEGVWMNPFIDATDCNYSTAADTTISFEIS